MPIIDLADEQGSVVFAPVKLLAVMLYPGEQEERLREAFLTAFKAQWIDDCRYEDPSAWDRLTKSHFSPEDFHTLLQSPSHADLMRRSSEQGRRGAVVGDVVRHMVQIAHSDNPVSRKYGTSVARAIHILSKVDYCKAKSFDGKRVRSSRKEMYAAWRTHKSVAHFWAAYRHGAILAAFLKNKNVPYRYETVPGFPVSAQESDEVDELRVFLLYAEAYRRFGVNNVPHGKQREKLTPTLPPQTTWEVHVGSLALSSLDQLVLPPLSDSCQPLLWPLSDMQKAVLEQYKAPRRFYC